MANPKLEFYRFTVTSKEGQRKTFRQFAIDELGAKKSDSNDDIFKHCFKHFVKELEAKHSKDEKKKKTITIVSKNNPYLSKKPTLMTNKKIIAGVINGGPYDKDAIVSDIADKEANEKLGRNKSVLLPYFIMLYLPPEHFEGIFAVHSHSREDSISKIFKGYVAKLFQGKKHDLPEPVAFCPKAFQNEFRQGATIQSMAFSNTYVGDMHEKSPFKANLSQFKIEIIATPQDKSVPISKASEFLDFLKTNVFKWDKSGETKLSGFPEKKFTVKNSVTGNKKIFEWNSKDNEFVPAIYLKDKGITFHNDVPDFEELKKYCIKIFEEIVLREIRPDLNVTKIN
ncbi:MAG: hypothetical protein HYZ14_15405 [Bacteroidetes bacterium]|nr:hypothetical protein [Bacteroidota bacterium]